ncbi:hypothetical protein [Rhodopirellula bahusiensis]|uniref:hypothetical protein n=1 Tax=Rhodopirellula bahusiensis TaxID=2014065 RepID=UPI00329A110D
MQSPDNDHDKPPLEIETAVAWPFVSRRVHTIDGSRHVWNSRPHRKGLTAAAVPRLSEIPSRRLNTSIGVIFAIGASCFAIASSLSLLPSHAEWPGFTRQINALYFVGSIPFTAAAGMQLFQAANVQEIACVCVFATI